MVFCFMRLGSFKYDLADLTAAVRTQQCTKFSLQMRIDWQVRRCCIYELIFKLYSCSRQLLMCWNYFFYLTTCAIKNNQNRVRVKLD